MSTLAHFDREIQWSNGPAKVIDPDGRQTKELAGPFITATYTARDREMRRRLKARAVRVIVKVDNTDEIETKLDQADTEARRSILRCLMGGGQPPGAHAG